MNLNIETFSRILAAIRAIDVLSILLHIEASQQSGLTKMAAVNFLASKNETIEARSSLLF